MPNTCTLFFLALCALGLPAQGIHWWDKTFDLALDRAKERNVPLLIAFIQDGEEANDRLWAAIQQSADFAKEANAIIPMIVSPSIHQPKASDGDSGPKRSVCGKFGHISCSDHIKLEREARAEFWPDGNVKTPSVIVFLPDRSEIERLIDVHDPADYIRAIKKGQKKLGVALNEEQWTRKIQQKAELESALKAEDFARALRARENLLALPQTPVLKTEIESFEARIQTAKKRALEVLAAQFDRGEHLAAFRAAKDAVEGLEKTAFAKDVQALCRNWERTKEGKAAKAILAGEERARPDLEKARVAWQKKDVKTAVKQWFRVLDRVDQGPLAEEAKSALDRVEKNPEWRKEAAEELAEGRADALLTRAQGLKKSDPEAALALLRQIVADYPETKAAKKAARLVAE